MKEVNKREHEKNDLFGEKVQDQSYKWQEDPYERRENTQLNNHINKRNDEEIDK